MAPNIHTPGYLGMTFLVLILPARMGRWVAGEALVIVDLHAGRMAFLTIF
jgi:hypothetical protein